PELAVDSIVRTGAGVSRARRRQTLLVVLRGLTFPRRGFSGREKRFVLQLPRALERRGRGGVPDAGESATADGGAGGPPGHGRGNEAQREQDAKHEECSLSRGMHVRGGLRHSSGIANAPILCEIRPTARVELIGAPNG